MTRLTLSPALLKVHFLRFGKMRASSDDRVTIGVVVLNFFLDMFFNTIHFPRWKRFTIGQCFQSVAVSAYANKFFDMRIPWSQLVILNRPRHSKSISPRRFEIKMTPSLCLACPYQGLSSLLIATNPVEWFFLDIWMFGIFYKKMFGSIFVRIATTKYWIIAMLLCRKSSAKFKIPRV